VDIATGTPREGSERGGGGGNRRRGDNNRNNSGRRESNRGPRGEGGRDSNRRGSEQRQQSQKELPKDVGTQFMGGRYARSDSGRGGGPVRRNDSSVSQGGPIRRNDSSVSQGSIGGGGGDAPARQRPSLKLAPRTKPVEKPDGGAQTSIFGGARPRDESKFVEKKESSVADSAVKEATGSMNAINVKDESGDAAKDSVEAADVKTSEPSEKQPPRRQDSKTGGRGGRKDNNGRRDSARKSGKDGERRGGGRGDKNRGRGEGGRNGKRNSTKSNAESTEKPQSSLAAAAATGTAAAPAALPVQTETKKGPKKSNSFAAFMDDSDED